MAKLYVGNLAASVTSEDLTSHFSRAGEVRGALAICSKTTGECRGFGFVEMADPEDAAVAYGLLLNTELKGKRISIDPLSTDRMAIKRVSPRGK